MKKWEYAIVGGWEDKDNYCFINQVNHYANHGFRIVPGTYTSRSVSRENTNLSDLFQKVIMEREVVENDTTQQ